MSEEAIYLNLGEPFIQLNPKLAVALGGADRALVLQHVAFLLARRANGVEFEGERWIWNSYRQWRENHFPWLSERTIQRIFGELEESAMLVAHIDSNSCKSYRLGMGAISKLRDQNYPNLQGFNERFGEVEKSEGGMPTCLPPGRQIGAPPVDKLASPLHYRAKNTNKEEAKASKRACAPEAEKPSLSQAESIYAAYPLKVGKQSALKAIAKALKSEPYVKLLEATQAFAKGNADCPESEKRFIKHPAAWFNGGHYDDDRSSPSWNRGKPPAATGLAPIGGKPPWEMDEHITNAKPPVYARRSQEEMDQDDAILEELRLNGI